MDTRSCLIGIKNSWPAVASPQLSSLIMARSSQQVNELLSIVLSWNLCVLNDSMIKRNIKWKFNPQSAPHHGGSMKFQTHVRSYNWNRKITDDILATPFCLVEQSLYARPHATASSAATDWFDCFSPKSFHFGKRVFCFTVARTNRYWSTSKIRPCTGLFRCRLEQAIEGVRALP